MMTGSIGYTHALTEYVVQQAEGKELVRRQLEDPTTDVLTGLAFLEHRDEAYAKEKKTEAAKNYVANASVEELADVYVEFMSVPEDDYVSDLINEELEGTTRADIEEMVLETYPEYASMLEDMDDDMLFDYIEQMITKQIEDAYAVQMESLYRKLSDEELAEEFSLLVLEDEDYLWIYEHAMPPVYSTSSFEENLEKLGYVDLQSPSVINIYASTFEDKDAIADAIERYNDSVDEEDRINYTDMVALLMNSITSIISAISYVLIAFVAISLVVSSIMIGIITYISVLERTKEIGILRAIGASKKDVSRVFNAETFIVGLCAGLIGILATIGLNIPINIIIHDLTGIMSIKSALPWQGAVALVIVSVFLTFIAGLIPSGVAAKKDPVEALRTE